MNACPECGEIFPEHVRFCPKHGLALVNQTTPERKDPLLGSQLGNYDLREYLGGGGFGDVYKAWERELEDTEAVKVIKRSRFDQREGEEAIRRFKREARVLRKLGKQSEHIVGVTVLDEDKKRDLLYFAMEYVDGSDLSRVIKDSGGPLEIPRVLDLTRQICAALRIAHEATPNPVVHRDLKLENIMVTVRGDREMVKVLDFGIAKILGVKSLADMSLGGPGTPGYAAPEQIARPKEIDTRTDLFALGVVIYCMMTGHEPWKGQSLTHGVRDSSDWLDIVNRSSRDKPQPARSFNPELPKDIEAVVLKLLEKEPAKRYQSAEELDAALAEIQKRYVELLPGSVRIQTPAPGVPFTLFRDGQRVATGRTPWEARSLTPGAYRIEVKDRRFFSESREFQLQSGGEADVELTAEEKEGGGWQLPTFVGRAVPASAVLVAAVVVWQVWPSTRELTYDDLMRTAQAGQVRYVEVDGSSFVGEIETDDGGEESFETPLEGHPLQATIASLEASGTAVRHRGRGTVGITPVVSDSGDTLSGPVTVNLSGMDGRGCQDCNTEALTELDAGWYAVDVRSEGWSLTDLQVRDPTRELSDESLATTGDQRLYVPRGREVELALALEPDDERTRLLWEAGSAEAEGDLVTAADRLERILSGDTGDSEVRARLAGTLNSLARRTLADGDSTGARAYANRCRQVVPGDVDCGRVLAQATPPTPDPRVAARPDSMPAGGDAGRGDDPGEDPDDPTPPDPGPAAPSVTAVRLDPRFDDAGSGSIAATLSLSAEAAVGTVWCAAARVYGSDRSPVRSSTSGYSVQGQLGQSHELRQTTSNATMSANARIPLEQVERSASAQVLYQDVAVWNRACGDVASAQPMMASEMSSITLPAAAPVEVPASVSGFGFAAFRLDDRDGRGIASQIGFSWSGPESVTWCVAIEYSAGGSTVASFNQEIQSSGGGGPVSSSEVFRTFDDMSMPDVRMEDVNVTGSARVWPGACSDRSAGERPLDQASGTQPVCVTRFAMGGWSQCR